jgi:hypothetical protein
VRPLTGLDSGDEVSLPQLAQNANFRTNLGFANMGGTTASVQFRLYHGDGSPVGTFILTIPPNQWRQDGEPFRRRFGVNNLSAVYVEVRVLSGTGVVAYASVVDNRTNDATTFPMKC